MVGAVDESAGDVAAFAGECGKDKIEIGDGVGAVETALRDEDAGA